jgi:hypothetical protein
MKRRLFFGVVSMCVALVAGCGGGGSSGKTANVQAGDMPEGGDWTGVYLQRALRLPAPRAGRQRHQRQVDRTAQGSLGRGERQVTGDLIRFEWKEHTVGLVGPNAMRERQAATSSTSAPPATTSTTWSSGEIGLNSDEVGDPWEA